MTDFKELLLDIYRCGGINQRWMNRRYRPDGEHAYVDLSLYDRVISKEGITFRIADKGVLEFDYDLSGIKKEDIVFDIGANVGSFALRAAQLSDYVFAIEPIMIKELRDNISLNKNLYVHPFQMALGDGTDKEAVWVDKRMTVRTYTLTQIMDRIGLSPSVLKCDCEGAEWHIKPEELDGVRKIEMELHYWNGLDPAPNPDLIEYINQHYDVRRVPDKEQPTELLHAVRKKEP